MVFQKRSDTAGFVCFAPESTRGSCSEVDQQSLQLTVVFTTVPATLIALRTAGNLARQLGGRIRILVPHVVPYALPLERPSVDPAFKVRRFSTLCCNDEVETRIEVRLCRNAQECVRDALTPESIVLIGGRKSLFPTWPKYLAKSLGRSGHRVIFITAG